MQRLVDIDREAGDARALFSAPVVAAAVGASGDGSTVAELQQQLQLLQERVAVAEIAKVKDMHAAATEHSEQLHRLHHKLAAVEMQVESNPNALSLSPSLMHGALQVLLLQRHDADLEKSIRALAADTSSKGSHSGRLSLSCTCFGTFD